MRNRFILIAVVLILSTSKSIAYQGGPGNAFRLDGSSYLELDRPLHYIDFPVTVEAWVFINDLDLFYFPVFTSHNDKSNTYNGLWTVIAPSRDLIFMAYGDGRGGNNVGFRRDAIAEVEVVANRWMHLAFVFASPTDMRIYLDGLQLNTYYNGTGQLRMDLDINTRPTIGYGFFNSSDYFSEGQIDEVRLWSTARSPEEIRRHMCQHVNPNENDLIGYWEMDDSNNSQIRDLSFRDNPANMMNSSSLRISGAPIGEISAFDYSINGELTDFNSEWDSPEFDFSLGLENVRGYHIYVNNSVEVVPECASGPVQGYFIPQAWRGDTTYRMVIKSDEETLIRYSNAAEWYMSKSIKANEPFEIDLSRWESIGTKGRLPEVTLPDDLLVCGDTLVELQAITEESSIVWSTGGTNISEVVFEPGIYWVQVSNECGVDTAFSEVTFADIPEVTITSELVEDCFLPFFQLEATANVPNYQLTWSSGHQSGIIGVVTSGIYSVTSKNECGEDTEEVSVIIPEPPLDRMPNIFTPNDDGVNDALEIPIELEGTTVKIFNRWGELVKQLEDYQSGTWEGDHLSDGVYFLWMADPCSSGTVKYPLYIYR